MATVTICSAFGAPKNKVCHYYDESYAATNKISLGPLEARIRKDYFVLRHQLCDNLLWKP